MNSTSEETKTGVQPLDADDANLADLSSDEELNGASEDDGPLHQAEEANNSMTISGDGPEILRVIFTMIRAAVAIRESVTYATSTYDC